MREADTGRLGTLAKPFSGISNRIYIHRNDRGCRLCYRTRNHGVFTQYGYWATITIVLATGLFIWLGTKIMIISRRIQAKSFEDLNKHLFGERSGGWISLFMFVILLGVNSIMLAGAGSVFMEHLNLSYQTGLFVTMIGTYFILRKGIRSIMTMNSFVVPMMLTLSLVIISQTIHSQAPPGS